MHSITLIYDYLNCIKEVVLYKTTKMSRIIHQEVVLYKIAKDGLN